MDMPHINPATMANFFDTFHWVADRWKKQAQYSENKNLQKHYQTCPPPIHNSFKKVEEDEVFVASEAVEIIIDIIEEVIGQRSHYIKELSQRWSDKIINMSFQHLRRWRNLRYQGVCTISQRIPHQYVATTFSGDPASKVKEPRIHNSAKNIKETNPVKKRTVLLIFQDNGECSVKWHNGNISVLVMVRGYNKIFNM